MWLSDNITYDVLFAKTSNAVNFFLRLDNRNTPGLMGIDGSKGDARDFFSFSRSLLRNSCYHL